MFHPSCVGPGSLEQLWKLCRAAGGIQLNGWRGLFEDLGL